MYVCRYVGMMYIIYMDVCFYVCMYVYVCPYIHTYLLTYIHVHKIITLKKDM